MTSAVKRLSRGISILHLNYLNWRFDFLERRVLRLRRKQGAVALRIDSIELKLFREQLCMSTDK